MSCYLENKHLREAAERKMYLRREIADIEQRIDELQLELDDYDDELHKLQLDGYDDEHQFEELKAQRDHIAAELMQNSERAEDLQSEFDMENTVFESVQLLKAYISEIIHKCDGDHWCLYTKHKQKNGKRRRLGKHSSKKAAEDQEKAIHAHGG